MDEEKTAAKFDRSPRDHLTNLAQALVAAVPWAGGSLATLMGKYLPESRERRLQNFIIDLAEKIDELRNCVDISRVFSDEYATLFEMTVREALLTVQQDKINAFKNELANSLRPDAPPWDQQESLMHLLSQLRAEHIRVLGHLRSEECIEAPQLCQRVFSLGYLPT